MAISRQQALDIARKRLAELGGDDLVIQEDAIVEREFGWVFLSNSRAFLETGDLNKAVPGVGPLVVDREDGSARFLSTSGAPEATINAYEILWREQRQG